MPILFIHGVSVRDDFGWEQVELLLRTYIAPKIADDPENVQITYCFWGDQASRLSWLGSSIPDSPATIALKTSIKKVQNGREKLAGLSRTAFKNRRFMRDTDGHNFTQEFKPRLSERLNGLSKERLSDLCASAIMQNPLFTKKEQALLFVAADDVVYADDTTEALNECRSLEEEIAFLHDCISHRFEEMFGEEHGKVIERVQRNMVDLPQHVRESQDQVLLKLKERIELRKAQYREIKNALNEKYDDLKQTVSGKYGKIKESVGHGYENLKHNVGERLGYEQIKADGSERLRADNIKERVNERLTRHAVWAHHFGNDLKEHLTRAVFSPAFAATRVAIEMRMPLNKFVSRFLGDVFTYLYRRGYADAPGPIPQRVMEHLLICAENQAARNGEPLIVLTHSMGGQIMYDMVTHFLPNRPEMKNVRIDFWCAAASQVGFFEELKLFLASSEEYGKDTLTVPYPGANHLGYWWNVWDHNDFVSYSAKGVIEGVDDEFYNTGMDLIASHIGYLILPSFYRRFAQKIQIASSTGFSRPIQYENK